MRPLSGSSSLVPASGLRAKRGFDIGAGGRTIGHWQATIKLDAYPHLDLRAHVDSIQLGSGSKFTAFPPENATGNFIKIVQRVPVKIVIDKGIDLDLPLPLGISAVPTVNVR